MSDFNPYEAPKAALQDAPAPVDARYVGLRGWLALLGIGLIYTLGDLLKSFAKIWRDDVQGQVFESQADLIAVCISLGITGISIGVVVALLILYFLKSFWFPRVFLVFSGLNVLMAFGILGFILSGLIPTMETSWMEMVLSIVLAVLWMLYVARSKRVKATFVR